MPTRSATTADLTRLARSPLTDYEVAYQRERFAVERARCALSGVRCQLDASFDDVLTRAIWDNNPDMVRRIVAMGATVRDRCLSGLGRRGQSPQMVAALLSSTNWEGPWDQLLEWVATRASAEESEQVLGALGDLTDTARAHIRQRVQDRLHRLSQSRGERRHPPFFRHGR